MTEEQLHADVAELFWGPEGPQRRGCRIPRFASPHPPGLIAITVKEESSVL
jgi:hypothetical protein